MTSISNKDIMGTMKYGLPLCLLLLLLFFAGCRKNDEKTYQGYAEGEFVNISSSQSGTLDKLFVKRGDQVSDHSNLFALECQSEVIALHQAQEAFLSAKSTLDDYQKGARLQELDVIQAQLSQAVANAQNAKEQLNRNALLYQSDSVSKEQLDNSTAQAKSTASRVTELTNALRVAKLSKRIDQIHAQEAHIKELESVVEQTRWKLNEKALKSHGNALVFDTLYREGEWVPAGGIVVRLLPPQNIKIRFFVPQAVAEKLTINQKAAIVSRSDAKKISVHVTYISTQAEYTPPIIYSNETKEKLTYMIEAYPNPANAPYLHPGQPVEVSLGF
jgi:HlyD family secretion protein